MNEIELMNQNPLAQSVRAEIDCQISTAHAFPRDVIKSIATCKEMATIDPETAMSMTYHIKRGGKTISGPTVRCAEVVAANWGNLRVKSEIISVGETHIVARGVAHDLQSNYAASDDVSVRITTRDGKRYGDDMITTAGNAACSKAFRNAIFKVVPRALVAKVETAAKESLVGQAGEMKKRFAICVEKFYEFGVTAQHLMRLVRENEELENIRVDKSNIAVEHIEFLAGIFSSINDGITTVDEAVPFLNEVDAVKESDRMKRFTIVKTSGLLDYMTDEQKALFEKGTKASLEQLIEAEAEAKAEKKGQEASEPKAKPEAKPEAKEDDDDL